eukprot:scaffold7400_cov20-Tisochrysis_lutea.AAC.1
MPYGACKRPRQTPIWLKGVVRRGTGCRLCTLGQGQDLDWFRNYHIAYKQSVCAHPLLQILPRIEKVHDFDSVVLGGWWWPPYGSGDVIKRAAAIAYPNPYLSETGVDTSK